MTDEQARNIPHPDNPFGYPTADVEEGRLFAILGYIIPILIVVPLIQRDNNFALFHAKQVILLALFAFGIMMMACIEFLFCMPYLFVPLLVAFWAIGLVFAIRGLYKPLPLLGRYAEEWFRGISVQDD